MILIDSYIRINYRVEESRSLHDFLVVLSRISFTFTVSFGENVSIGLLCLSLGVSMFQSLV